MTKSFLSGLLVLLGVGCGESVVEGEGEGGAGVGGTGVGGTGGQASCAQQHGVLQGDVFLFAPPGHPDSEPAPSADTLVVLQKIPAPPIHAMIDDAAHFSVELAEGDWAVGAEGNGGCFTEMDQTVTITACETATVELVLSLCAGG